MRGGALLRRAKVEGGGGGVDPLVRDEGSVVGVAAGVGGGLVGELLGEGAGKVAANAGLAANRAQAEGDLGFVSD